MVKEKRLSQDKLRIMELETLIISYQRQVHTQNEKIKELEHIIDNLLKEYGD